MNFRDRVKVLSSTTGPGDFLLEATPVGFRPPPQVFSSGMRFTYVIQNSATGEWEIGIGAHVYSGGSTLVRESPLYSSSGSLPHSFGSGSKDVFCAHPAFLSESEAWRTFGTSADGDANVTTLVTLQRDAEYRNLTISGASGAINTNGFRLRVSGTCDLTGAIAGAIQSHGGSGGAGGVGTAGAVASLPSGTRAGAGGQGGAGAAGGTAGGANATAPTSPLPANGGDSFVYSGNGGDAGANLGGGGGRASQLPTGTRYGIELLVGVASGFLAYVRGGAGGHGGGGGAGDGTVGGGGGAGGNGGSVLDLAFAVLKLGPGTSASAIFAGGGGGGAGGAPAGGNRGGGGGGAGGGGGYVHLVVGAVVGGPKPDLISCPGGPGGNGGAKTGTGIAGTGGGGASGGRIQVINLSESSYTETVGTAGTAGSGATGGAGGVCVGGV